MKIFFLHGLESTHQSSKVDFMRDSGHNVHAKYMDYKNVLDLYAKTLNSIIENYDGEDLKQIANTKLEEIDAIENPKEEEIEAPEMEIELDEFNIDHDELEKLFNDEEEEFEDE